MDELDKIRIKHMIDASEEALSFVQGKVRNDLNSNRMLVLSIIKEIEIIGEAASKISKITSQKYSDIPWQDVIGMRNKLIHGYFEVDLDIVWMTISDDIPRLLSVLKKVIQADQ